MKVRLSHGLFETFVFCFWKKINLRQREASSCPPFDLIDISHLSGFAWICLDCLDFLTGFDIGGRNLTKLRTLSESLTWKVGPERSWNWSSIFFNSEVVNNAAQRKTTTTRKVTPMYGTCFPIIQLGSVLLLDQKWPYTAHRAVVRSVSSY